ncbi:MAG: peptidase C1 [Bacteroidetes bacterium]|nr:peptidase C1 [Bacteroidota bacterium]
MKTSIITGVATALLLALSTGSWAQDRHDAGQYIPAKKNNFFESIESKTDSFFKQKKEPVKRLYMDYTGVEVPKSINEFKMVASEKPVSQGITGTCWCFSTSSFYESEAARLGHPGIRLSEMFTVYWEYVEKAKEFVRTRGKSKFDEGSETNAVQRMMSKYGAVPLEAYTGLKPGQPYLDHAPMIDEMRSYLEGVKQRNAWNTDEVVATIKDIMNHYIGVPPSSVAYQGKQLSPKQYLRDVVGINPSDYVTFMSLKSEPMWTNAEYKVGDNWWHSKDYYNVPLSDFIGLIKNALKQGYSISIGGDVSEPGIDSKLGIMMIPSFDIPSSYINDDARLMRYLNGATTDDHAMHIVGYTQKSNGTWFLVKDSGSGGHNNLDHTGYWYMHEDYVKLKMMTATVNKNAVKDVLQKIAAK